MRESIIKHILTAMAVVTVTSAAQAQDTIVLPFPDHNPRMYLLTIDRSKIQRDGDIADVEYYFGAFLPPPSIDRYSEEIRRVRFNCKYPIKKTISWSTLSNGKMLHYNLAGDKEWERMLPGSSDLIVYKAVCGPDLATFKSEGNRDPFIMLRQMNP